MEKQFSADVKTRPAEAQRPRPQASSPVGEPGARRRGVPRTPGPAERRRLGPLSMEDWCWPAGRTPSPTLTRSQAHGPQWHLPLSPPNFVSVEEPHSLTLSLLTCK